MSFSRIAIAFSVILLTFAEAASAGTPPGNPRLGGGRTRMFDPAYDLEDAAPSVTGFFQFFDSLRAPQVAPEATAAVETGYFDQLLDPLATNAVDAAKTFRQRFYVYSQHARSKDAPVLYYICGEAECLPKSFLGRFTEEVARALHARVIALEHRYYGQSVPFDQLTTANLKHLSTENALLDLERFQRHAITQWGYSGKWLTIGGSYPGSLSAFYRLRYPHLVSGALASSAPVQARNAYEDYDGHVTQVVGPACAAALRKVVEASEVALADSARGGDGFARFKARFGASEIREDRDFLYVLADVTAGAVQYGTHLQLCALMTRAADPVEAYVGYVRNFLIERGETAAGFSPQGAMALGAQDSGGMRQWYYQSCTEYGYWQDAHRDPARSVRSARINQDYDRDYCQRMFGITELADEAAINARYYAELLKPATTRILYTNGSDDPWSVLSITPVLGNDTNVGTPALMIQGKAHCSDLRAAAPTDPQSLKDARARFISLATDWIR